MWTELHWVDGPWPGKLAMAARPRGGEWLADEIAHWRSGGADVVLSLLEKDEERELGLMSEGDEVRAKGMMFRSFPIADRDVPTSEGALVKTLDALDSELMAGKNIVLHCRQGVGRTGLVAACLFLAKGLDSAKAIERLSAARGIAVPETVEQRRWIEHYAESLAATR